MRKCPSCAYNNSDNIRKCGICGRDVSSVTITFPPPPKKDSHAMLITGLLLLACGAFFFFMQGPIEKKMNVPRSSENALTDEKSFNYEGVLYGLDKMGGLKFLPDSDKRRVPPLISSPDYKVSYAAVKLIGAWSRDVYDQDRRHWFEILLETSESSAPVSSCSRAAVEAGTTIALGFPPGAYLAHIKEISASLTARDEVDMKAGGFFLASMAGLSEFEPEMLYAMDHDSSVYVKLYAACALSRLGRAEGHKYLLETAFSATALRTEAISCIAFSASPEADKVLAGIAGGKADAEAAETAKRGLILRKQLAIIKK